MKKNKIPKDILERVENELLTEEQLLWVGLPGKKSNIDMTVKATIAGLVGTLMLGMFAFLLVARNSGSLWLTTSTIPIVLLLIGLAFFAIRAQTRNQADLYAISNRRAMIFSRNKVQSFGKNDLRFIERQMNRDGTGNILFDREYYQSVTMAGTTPVTTHRSEEIGFFGIENPSEVEALMLETFRSEIGTKNKLDDNIYDYDQPLQNKQYS